MIVWDSPYGLCAYDHRKSEYAGSAEDLRYMLNEAEIEALCRSLGLNMYLVPKSERQN